MAATAGSPYQIIRTNHINGSPPETDPQRASETYEFYIARMALAGLPPDINATESDPAYLARLASYKNPPFSRVGYGSIQNTASPLTTSFTNGGNTTVSRSAAGVYPITMLYANPATPLHVDFQGFSAGTGGNTGSFYYVSGPTPTGVTMSVYTETSPLVLADPTSGSFIVWN